MTRKDFIAIAKIIKDSEPRKTKAKRLMVAELCDLYKQTNPRFDRERFKTACGL